MGRYVVRRLLQFIPTVFFTMFLLHYLTVVGIQFTGNPVRAIFGERRPPPETIEQVTRALKLDDPCLKSKFNPCFELFGDRLQGIFLQFDFGTNLRFRPVTDILADAVPFTLKLTLIAFTIEAIVGILAGVLAGLRSGSFMDYFVKISTVIVIAVPIFVLAVLIRQYVGIDFGNYLRSQDWVPDLIANGIFGVGYKAAYPWASLIMPGVVLGALSLATTARLTRTSIAENIRADYIRTAKAKGLTNKRVIGVHTLRNSLIPVATNLGLSIGGYITGAIITEGVFNVPGVGSTINRAIFQGESMTIIGVTTMLVLVYLVANLLVDLLYAVLDPRIRYE